MTSPAMSSESVSRPASSPARGKSIKLPADLFKLGVASGEPEANSVVLWTRLAPDPLHGGGMPDQAVEVEWEMALDEQFKHPVLRGTEMALPEDAHSVHIEPNDLSPEYEYFYRFRVGTEISPVGRTRTSPPPGARVDSLRYAYASCQNWQGGFYTALRDIAEQDVHFVVFLGDYIYESKPNPAAPRQHEGTDEPVTLEQYRNRFAQYKTDPDLQAAHAAHPWVMTIDDHEVDNDWASRWPQDPDLQTPEAFYRRKVAAFKAWYEHAPVRMTSRPNGGHVQIYRRFDWGDLARVHVLDTRQYRSDQPKTIEEANEPWRTITGRRQESWLVSGLTGGPQRWNLLANQAAVNQMPPEFRPDPVVWLDPWDGYLVQRRRIMRLLGSDQVANPLVITGDRHFTMVCDLLEDFDDPSSPVAAAEIVGTSISSGGDEDQAAWHRQWDPAMAAAPYWKYGESRRGYMLCDTDRERTLTTLRVASTVLVPDGTMSDGAQFLVEAGRRGVEIVSTH